jgi:hypothetical protein
MAGLMHNMSVNVDAHGRPLPSVAPGVRQLRLRQTPARTLAMVRVVEQPPNVLKLL